jgi:2',3'-cyclic-nucleotide 2'-phosphodiesterase (5'-nucleotidase family)
MAVSGRTARTYAVLCLAWCVLASACGTTATRPSAIATPAAAAFAGSAVPPSAYVEEPSAPRAQAPLTILQINDVYSTVPVAGRGGLARVAALKQLLSRAGRTPLLVLAGDFLSPSVASSVFKGEQMVAALNAAGLDIATFGNHEFDFGLAVLRQRIKESKWTWLASNVTDAAGLPLAGTVPYLVRTFGELRVGFIGLCLTSQEIRPEDRAQIQLIDPIEAAARYLPKLREERVDVVVAVTHLAIEEDQKLVERFPDIDIVVGGHEHSPITVTQNRTLISKAGSDAEYVARIDVVRRGAALDRYFELVPVDARLPDEPATARVVAEFERRLGTEMDVPVATSLVDLDASTLRLRAGETNVGNLFADAIRASVGADIALVNSGAIRGDRVYPAGVLTRRVLLAMHPFGNVVSKLELPGRTVQAALEHGVSQLPATAGFFPQVSGLSMEVAVGAPVGTRVRNVRVNGQPLDPERAYTLAVPDFLLGGDGYAMLLGPKVLVGPATGDLVVTAVERYVEARRTIAPAIEHRTVLVR